MCYQLIELYSACRCLYYQHAVDRCSDYGRPGHDMHQRTILVGYSCSDHAAFLSDCGTASSVVRSKPTRKGNLNGEHTPRPSRVNPNAIFVASTRLTTPNENNSQILASEVEKLKGTEHYADFDLNQYAASGSGKDDGPSTAVELTVSKPRRRLELRLEPQSITSKKQSRLKGWVHDQSTPNQDQMWDSDESSLSEAESIISSASSATTVDIDTLEAIFRRLLQHQELRFLWPQVVSRSRSRLRSLRNLERFLRRYADDLHDLAKSEKFTSSSTRQVQIDASRFLRRSRLNLAQRIFEAYIQLCPADFLPGEGEFRGDKLQVDAADESDDSIDDSSFGPVYTVAEAFLFETEPIICLTANIKEFVTMPRPKQAIDIVKSSFKVCFENLITDILKPPVGNGKKRAAWTCKCGKQLYDDFVELRPGAVADLELELRKSNIDVISPTEHIDANNLSQHPKDRKYVLTQLWNGFHDTCLKLIHRKQPQQGPPKQLDLELGLCLGAPKDTNGKDHNFLLLCIPFLRYATKLHQAEVCRINSDQDLFRLLRHYYFTQRGRSAWTRLRKVHGIEFIMFEMYKSHLADVQSSPSLPSDATHNQYVYEPMPAEVVPPIGSNHLMHLFEHPEDADVLPVLYRKIPRKIGAKLEACPRKGSSAGWGLQYVEGMNWFVVFVYGCAGFGLALFAAVVWAATRADVQGAFAIAGFMIAFLLFCGGIARAEIHI